MKNPSFVKPVEVTVTFIYHPDDYLNFCEAENTQPVQTEFNDWVMTYLEEDLPYFWESNIDLRIAK